MNDPLVVVSEVSETLERAVQVGRLTLEFDTPEEAKSWYFRAYNHIRRRAPHLRQLMMSRRGNVIRIYRPNIRISEGV
jgi:hypothetical protein